MAEPDDPQIHTFVRELVVAMMEPRRFQAIYRAPKDPAGLDTPFTVTNFLEVDLGELSPAAAKALEAIEAPGGDHHEAWTDFKWKLTAFTYIQDIFDTVLRDGDDALILFQQHYFYFESYHLLAESILCGLNGFYVAAQALLRPFLEFSLLQNYYHHTLSNQHSYAPLEQFFKTGTGPATSTVMKHCLPKDDFCRPIRFRLNQHLGGLSQSTLHPYHPNHSARQHSASVGTHSFAGLHSWFTTRLILEAALWVYYVNFPLLFHPVNILRKFGYNGPVGIFIDEPGGTAVRQSLSSDDYERFKAYADAQPDTKARLKWFSEFPDLQDSQIEASWHTEEYGEFPGLWAGFCAQMARQRVMRRSLAVRRASAEDVPDDVRESLNSLAGWRRFSGGKSK